MYRTVLAAALALFSSIREIHAQCADDCDVIYPMDYGWYADGSCGVDAGKGTYPEYAYEVCPCLSATWTQAATFTGNDGSTTVETMTSTLIPQTTTTVYWAYSAIQNTKIGTQSVVYITQEYQNPTAMYFPTPALYTNSPNPSIYYTVATSTATSVSTTTSSTTTTITDTATSHIPQTILYGRCTTGTLTLTAKTVTKTVYSTITPAPATIVVNKQITTTTTLTCLPSQTSAGARKRQVAARQIQGHAYEQPNCGLPLPTTYTTSTSWTTSTSTQILTSTIPTTTTSTLTITPTPATILLCTRVRGTVITTPTFTKTSVFVAARQTSVTTSTLVNVITVVPSGLAACNSPTPTFAPSAKKAALGMYILAQ